LSVRLAQENLSGNDAMLLTKRQVNKIEKVKQLERGGMDLQLSQAQIKKNLQKPGGFLPMLAGLAGSALPMIAKTIASFGCAQLSC